MESSVKQTALVTGASAGIGKEFARELAKDGFDLILTARRIDRLNDLRKELEGQYPVDVTVLGYDLSDSDTPQKLYMDIQSSHKTIDFLVNNAGYGNPNLFIDEIWKEHAAFIQAMLTAVCEMTHLCLPSMIENNYGRIINVASIAGYLPGTHGNTLYGATKSFLIKFTESLSLELDGTGVNCSVVCPGYTYSEFHDVTKTREKIKHLPSFMWMDANTVARQSIHAVHSGQVVYINGLINRLIASTAKITPQKIGLLVSRKHSRKLYQ